MNIELATVIKVDAVPLTATAPPEMTAVFPENLHGRRPMA